MTLRSIQTKTTMLTVCATAVATLVITLMGIVAIHSLGKNDADELLALLCDTGEKNLGFYFESVEQSVQMVSAFVESDLAGLSPEQLDEHLERTNQAFEKLLYTTNGVLTYYYRLDPEVTSATTGFWFVNIDGTGFVEHETTDISLYDTSDTSRIMWFTVPKSTGEPVWLSSYIPENLDMRVISYNVPVYWRGRFIGVIGIEIDYSTVAGQVDSLKLYDNGYAFLVDAKGNLIYHPVIDVTTASTLPEIPDGIMSDTSPVSYVFDSVRKEAVWLSLSNGMRLYITVPANEIDVAWARQVWWVALASMVILVVTALVTRWLSGRITQPLAELADVSKHLSEGAYDCEPTFEGDDEVGTISDAIRTLVSHLGVYIEGLGNASHVDPLTAVRNRSAYELYMRDLQHALDGAEDPHAFGVCLFDCNGLSSVNGEAGRDKGDIYLRESCSLVCKTFSHSPVFHLDQDQFVVILRGSDFENRDELMRQFDDKCAEHRRTATYLWERLDVSHGLAVWDPDIDDDVNDVVRRAGKRMHDHKDEHRLMPAT